ncbi:CPBP family intramembrane glutamic endopeptidase [Aurantiacibacter poecillastricola]|uniref:CPBP family intramembrane glutamic endopeptidase n=1 Tax=Aurantiacibacter poecillastricola TaxID=3064385 RepID=UPI00273F4011|nr:type II CAAX endopeptidase family protein [Aurantiacibacter sp. 219JJ12-13]MDP5260095.1 type II CAAX endopeptidase family protein [Aurantiacibacter sp. 219JJ12-13]
MTNPASVLEDRQPAAPYAKAPIGWLIFVLQFVTVALAYVLASILPTLPALIATVSAAISDPAAATPAPELGSGLVASTVIASAIGAIFVAWLWLRREGRVMEALRLKRPASWRFTIGLAALATGGTILIFVLGAQLTQALGLGSPDPSFVLDLVTESPALFALWVVGIAWFAAGFGEEVLYRGFLMDRLERLPGLRGRTNTILFVQAILFGLPHAYQGAGGMVVTAMVGLLLGWVRNRSGGNLWAAIIAHAMVDTIMMSLAFGESLGCYAT